MTVVLFYLWEVAKTVPNFFSGKLSNSLLVCCVSFPEHRVPLSWSPPWTSIRACWRPGNTMGNDFIPVEQDAKWQFSCHLKGEKSEFMWLEIDALPLFLNSQEKSRISNTKIPGVSSYRVNKVILLYLIEEITHKILDLPPHGLWDVLFHTRDWIQVTVWKGQILTCRKVPHLFSFSISRKIYSPLTTQ